jgi:ribokinase
VTRVAVVGHVEWLEFAVVDHVPRPGEIVESREDFSVAAGGGAVAAVQMRKLAGVADFFTALGSDREGHASADELRERGLDLHAAHRDSNTRRAFSHLSDDHERTITVFGERLVPHGDDDLPWERLAEADAVYFTGGDVGALQAARAARVLVATPRALPVLERGGIRLDVLVASGTDAGEAYEPGTLDPDPHFVVLTHGAEGGDWTGSEGRTGHWAAAELPGEPVDAYGCGDSFAAGLTFALGRGDELPKALEVAARCGAHCLCGRGPYEGQLTS